MTLLPYEQRAKDFVLRIGIERATRLLELASGRIDRRVRKANEQSFGQFFAQTTGFPVVLGPEWCL